MVWSLPGSWTTGLPLDFIELCIFSYERTSQPTIGKFYCSIDSRLLAKWSRPDNIHRFVDGIATFNRVSEQLMVYDAPPIRSMRLQLKMCTETVESLNSECTELKTNFQQSRTELQTTKATLGEITFKNTALQASKSSKVLKKGYKNLTAH